MKKDGYSENTIEPIGKRLKNLAKQVSLDNPDERYESKYLIHEEELEEGNKMRILEDGHYDSETDEIFWHWDTDTKNI